jgi:hypothetical protein
VVARGPHDWNSSSPQRGGPSQPRVATLWSRTLGQQASGRRTLKGFHTREVTRDELCSPFRAGCLGPVIPRVRFLRSRPWAVVFHPFGMIGRLESDPQLHNQKILHPSPLKNPRPQPLSRGERGARRFWRTRGARMRLGGSLAVPTRQSLRIGEGECGEFIDDSDAPEWHATTSLAVGLARRAPPHMWISIASASGRRIGTSSELDG